MTNLDQVHEARDKIVSVCLDDRTLVVQGKWIKVAAVMDEELVKREAIQDPIKLIGLLKQSGMRVDIFTFAQKIPDVVPRYQYRLEWDNAAVIPITDFSDWWSNRVQYDVRKAVNRAKRMGVVVKVVDFNDELVEGIRTIYDEDAIRQGRPFWHYNKDFEIVKKENSTYIDRSTFIGAYHEGDLIGFIRMVHVDFLAMTLQVISRRSHFDKKPTNALIAKAVEVCVQKGVSHLVYGNYVYNDPNSSLTEFKRRNGFEMFLIPRYYVPLTGRGHLVLRLNLHRPLVQRVPPPILERLRKLRALWYQRRNQRNTEKFE